MERPWKSRALSARGRRPLLGPWDQIPDHSLGDVGRPLMRMRGAHCQLLVCRWEDHIHGLWPLCTREHMMQATGREAEDVRRLS
jgi:hypothetical protein